MVAPVKAASSLQPVLEVAAPQSLFQTGIPSTLNFPYAVAADGKRFLMNIDVGDTVETPLTVVVNWLAAVNK